LLLLVGLLSWRIVFSGIAEYYSQQDDRTEVVEALLWQPLQPQGLYQQALTQLESAPPAAERLLQAAAWADPSDALVYLALADLWVKAGRVPVAQGLVAVADALGPMRPPVLSRSADFWLRQGQWDRVLARWSNLLLNRPENAKQLFPVLLRVAENPASRPLLQPFLEQPPAWWLQFFSYTAQKAQSSETVLALYQARRRRGDPLDKVEQQAYLDRLLRDKRWLDAYLAWLNGLDDRQLTVLGNIYNGSFELPLTSVGFDWRVFPLRGVVVETAQTYGTRGDKALHINFNGQRAQFRHVLQYLFLEPGQYRLRGWVRVDQLRTERGLRWTMRCAPDQPVLVASELFLGSDDWRLFGVEFTVPESDCMAQMLRLELEGRAALDFEVEGDIWFDDLSVVRLEDR
jgi:tetratricopeptide (TPR) repeat protein